MSAPPPYPPQNPGQYPPPDPRYARQQVKAYARAQRDQARAQRQYWRGYWRGGRPSIVGPLLILAIGIIALLVELGQLDGYAIWSWYVQWWPLLLIALGVALLGEYFLDRGNPYARRRSGGGIIFLIVVLLFVGWAAHGARHWGEQWGIGNNNDFWYMFGQEHDNHVQMDHAIPLNGAVSVQVPRGDVTITPSNDGQIHLQAHEIVHTSSNEKAQKAFDRVRPQIASSGSGLAISVPSYRGSAVDLTISVPEKSAVTINTGHGDVSVEGLKANVDVTDAGGDVKLDGISGDVHAQMRDGDFSAHAIGGQVFVNGHAGDVTLSEIAGQTVMNGEFFGDTHLEQMGGPFHFHSSRTTIDVPRMEGDLTLDSDDLQASQISGPVRIVTRSKNIELTQAAGDIHIEDSDGDVNVTTAAPLGNIEIMNHTGDVSVTVPENASFSVAASTTQDDDLDSDFSLESTSTGSLKQLSGTVGHGGVKLDLSTTHGDMALRKGMAAAAIPAPPKPPKPEGPERHLRAPKTPVAPVQQ